MSFRVVAIPTKVADLVRSTLRAPGYGHPALPGPIFIHAEPCERCSEIDFPEDLRGHRLTFAAYGAGRPLLAEEYIDNGQVEPVIASLLNRDKVRYLHVRDTAAGCYDFRIARETPV